MKIQSFARDSGIRRRTVSLHTFPVNQSCFPMKTYPDPFPRTPPDDPQAPVVLVVGPNGGNRGDQLMMQAIADRWAGRVHFPPPMMLRVPLAHIRSPRNAWCMGRDILGRLQHRFRFGTPTLILDCSGYQYADAWASMVPFFRMRLRLYRHLIRKGARLVFLPQSYGPFTHPELRTCCQELLSLAERIYVRDSRSSQHLTRDLEIPETLLLPAPDFTSPVPGILPDEVEPWQKRFLLIPNRNMVEKTEGFTQESYIQLFLHAAVRIRTAGLEPVLLVHDDGDLELAVTVAQRCDPPLTVLDPEAAEAKGCMRLSCGVMASRYHALISALSQGIPAVGTSWSHKYAGLFEDYGVPELLLNPEDRTAALDAALDSVLAPGSRLGLVESITRAAEEQREKTEAMWKGLEDAAGIPEREAEAG
jgi:colanic acid/amylovoran biosynthesis protein